LESTGIIADEQRKIGPGRTAGGECVRKGISLRLCSGPGLLLAVTIVFWSACLGCSKGSQGWISGTEQVDGKKLKLDTDLYNLATTGHINGHTTGYPNGFDLIIKLYAPKGLALGEFDLAENSPGTLNPVELVASYRGKKGETFFYTVSEGKLVNDHLPVPDSPTWEGRLYDCMLRNHETGLEMKLVEAEFNVGYSKEGAEALYGLR